MIEDLKLLGREELEKRATRADELIRALNFDTSEEGRTARESLVRQQTLLNEARAELLAEEDLPEEVVVGMKPADMGVRIEKPTGRLRLEQING